MGPEKYVDEQLGTDGRDDLRLELRIHGNKQILNRHPAEIRTRFRLLEQILSSKVRRGALRTRGNQR